MASQRKLLFLLVLLCLPVPCSRGSEETRRPKIGLALGGGSARGLAHVGVLQWFDEHRIPVDCIAGTSMGSIIGGLYATGMPAGEIASMLNAVEWDDFFMGDVPYEYKAFRRKQDRRDYPVRLEFGLRKGFNLPSGLEAGHSLGLMLNRVTLPYSSVPSFDDLPIPYRAVATDLENAQSVVMRDGSLSEAIRASMAIPGVFTPVIRDGRFLGDGGLLNNVPADVVKSMGAKVVIAVDVGSKPQDRTYVQSFAGMLDQAITVMIVANTREILRFADLVIAPDLDSVSPTDWRNSDGIAKLGYESAQAKERFLNTLSVDAETWNAHLRQRKSRIRTSSQVIEFMVIEGTGAEEQEHMRIYLRHHLGHPVDTRQIEADLTAIAGRGRLESVGYELRQVQGQTGLRIVAKEKSYGPPFVNFLLRVDNARQGAMDLVLGSRFTFFDIGTHGSELRVDLKAGSEQVALGEYFWRPGRRGWFVAPQGVFESSTQNLYVDGSRIADYRIRRVAAQVDAGYEISRNSQVSLGYGVGHMNARVRSGNPLLPAVEGRIAGPRIRWTYNHLDSPMVPTSGVFAHSGLQWVLDSPSGFQDFPSAEVHFGGFKPVGKKNTLSVMFDGGTTFAKTPSPVYQFTLGGPFRLGAYDLDYFRGSHYLYFSPGYLRKIGRLPDLIGGNAFIGGWAEVGDAFDDPDSIRFKVDVSGGLLVESPLGPLFIGGSWGEGGNLRFNFALGSLIRRDKWIQ